MTDERGFPLQSVAVRKWTAMQDICPECGGELDTGWECNSCGFDALPLVQKQFGLPAGGG
jgi:tRNA(Ile2) C34 agmatinyltransferase TiaS